MAITRADKENLISDISGRFSKAQAAFLVDFKGMTVEQVTNLRLKLRRADSEMKVVRNTLALRALSEFPKEKTALEKSLVGTNAIVFAYKDASATAKTLSEYASDVEKMELKVGVLGGEALDKAKIKYLATLPPLEVLRAQLLGLLQAPATKFVGTLAAVPGGFARLLGAQKAKLEGK
ncbi:MAG: 50S ribosomal protein L10 [Bdellovibrionales bacterium]|nr:50S ribosomal protein L10 [Bdellovibrionales bacterium]